MTRKMTGAGLMLVGLAVLLLSAACQTKINDDTLPQVSIVYPRNGETLVTGIIPVKVVATDPVGIDSVLFFEGSYFIDKKIYGRGDTFTGLWKAPCDTSQHLHIFKAAAFDRAGNHSAAFWVQVWVVPARERLSGLNPVGRIRLFALGAEKGVSR